MKRLEESALKVGIAVGDIVERIKLTILEGLRRNDCPHTQNGDSLIRAYITGGDTNYRGLFHNPRYFIIFEQGEPIDESEYSEGITLQPTAEYRPYPLVKSVNYLVGIMQSAGREDVSECLYCPGGEALEALKSSFFMCKDNMIVTAPVGMVLGGVTRNIVVDLAKTYGFKVDERAPKVAELLQADEAFITGTWKEVVPVVRIGDITIGDGRPGPITQRLHRLYRASRDRWLHYT
jgi:branched-chain amino acid aminotransferase